ncbi:ABC-type transport auxiliary lipoprotein family protein [Primorskyibacter aestuariivivens]|uniref:PqiC family protein n=1 Tax=Primorskyibacter aestuariivivens TaxID=1888912 RepID=UPI0023016E27|nr:ABC-type transport auxiliary lipoprotein family protein [Primorskyibacter aestuariivivens]MDA7427604.1 ABC-type transport auxiliary lipoprotein family protein [Primorskyibacter aestuariivivens]
MTFRSLPAALLLAALAACGDSTPQYLVETRPTDVQVRARVSTLLVRTVSLPTYAADQKIAVQTESGSVQATDFGLWADEPERATTLSITRNLNTMTSAKVAPEPWPLPEPAQGVLDIRIETFIATKDNTFRAAGQYFMGSVTPDPIEDPDDPDKPPRVLSAPLPDKAKLFDIVIPFSARTPAAIAAAQTAALSQLSEQIARDLAR